MIIIFAFMFYFLVFGMSAKNVDFYRSIMEMFYCKNLSNFDDLFLLNLWCRMRYIFIVSDFTRREIYDMKGKVKWFNNDKGFGFIEYKEGEDIFVHYSSILSSGYKTLVEGQYVEFELVRTDKGLQAKNVVEIKTALV